MNMTEELKVLYQKMYELTHAKCVACCPEQLKWSCCSPEYGDFAMAEAKKRGEVLVLTGLNHPKCALLGENGCVAPPHLRQMCTLHVCEKLLMTDLKFYKQYFKVRDKIDILETKRFVEESEEKKDESSVLDVSAEVARTSKGKGTRKKRGAKEATVR